MSSLSFIVEEDHHIVLKGDMTFVTVGDALQESYNYFSGDERLRVDLRGVRRVDSAGLALLIEWLRRMRGEQREVQFMNFPDRLEGRAQVSGVGEILNDITCT